MEELVLGERGKALADLDRQDNACPNCKSAHSSISHQDSHSRRPATPSAAGSSDNPTAGSGIPYRNSFAAETHTDSSFKARRKAATRFVSQINDSLRPDLVKIDREVGLRAHMDFRSLCADELKQPSIDVAGSERNLPLVQHPNPLTVASCPHRRPGVSSDEPEDRVAEDEPSKCANAINAVLHASHSGACHFSSIVILPLVTNEDHDCEGCVEFQCAASSLVVEHSTVTSET